jgi:hypothetical protein
MAVLAHLRDRPAQAADELKLEFRFESGQSCNIGTLKGVLVVQAHRNSLTSGRGGAHSHGGAAHNVLGKVVDAGPRRF